MIEVEDLIKSDLCNLAVLKKLKGRESCWISNYNLKTIEDLLFMSDIYFLANSEYSIYECVKEFKFPFCIWIDEHTQWQAYEFFAFKIRLKWSKEWLRGVRV